MTYTFNQVEQSEQSAESKTVCSFLDVLHNTHTQIKQTHVANTNQIAGAYSYRAPHRNTKKKERVYKKQNALKKKTLSKRCCSHTFYMTQQLEKKVSRYIHKKKSSQGAF